MLSKLFIDRGYGSWDTPAGIYFFVGYFAIIMALLPKIVKNPRICQTEVLC
jgi:hypothetical protein